MHVKLSYCNNEVGCCTLTNEVLLSGEGGGGDDGCPSLKFISVVFHFEVQAISFGSLSDDDDGNKDGKKKQ